LPHSVNEDVMGDQSVSWCQVSRWIDIARGSSGITWIPQYILRPVLR